jgi:UDP-GlcNAc:undecaprenyl-phosphate/decaprenyl-phosphate GlcNAc-1-phosphate transferase
MFYFSTTLISFLITIILIPIFKHVAIRINLMDIPDKRKVHTQPIPKCGGVAMAFGTLFPVLYLSIENKQISSILIGAVIIVIFGVLDDLKDLNYKIKFAGQIVASLIVILWGGISIKSLGMLLPGDFILPYYVSIPLTLFIIVGVTNAVNLADGLDGLAGGISILSFCLIGYLSFMSQNYVITLISFAVIGSVFGFLRFNNYPATLFMGDAGSQFLGFLAITLSLIVTQENSVYNVMLPLFIVGVPVFDTIWVMTQRLMEGRPVFSADKNHMHHKLMEFGFYQTETVFLIYVLQTFMILSGYLLRFQFEWALLLLYLVLSSLILLLMKRAAIQSWRFRREAFINLNAIKERLRFIFREEHVGIKISFGLLKFAVPTVFFISCLLPEEIPSYLSLLVIAFAACLVILLLFKRNWLGKGIIRLFLYLTIPLVLYLGETSRSVFINPLLIMIYNASQLALIIPAIVVLRFTRRKDGYATTPMDYLIFLLAIALAFIPGINGIHPYMKLLVTKIMVLFYSYEVLFGELRGKVRWLGWVTAASFLILGIKGIV